MPEEGSTFLHEAVQERKRWGSDQGCALWPSLAQLLVTSKALRARALHGMVSAGSTSSTHIHALMPIQRRDPGGQEPEPGTLDTIPYSGVNMY